MSNIIKNNSESIKVKGKGKNKQEAFAAALNKVSKEIAKSNDILVFKVEPKAFDIISLKEIKETEHFLFIFFPRVRISYEVELLVKVDIQYISFNELPVEEVQTSDNKNMIREMKGVQ